MTGVQTCALPIYVDYATRGEQSRRDRDIVVRACADASIPLQSVILEERLRGPHFQDRARRLRLDAAARLLDDPGYDLIATGHTLDDRAETILSRLAKYGAPSALGALPPRAGRSVRPLLCLRAAEVRAYCDAAGIVWGLDESNLRPDYSRNLLRLEALPVLERVSPRAAESLAAAGDALLEEHEVLTRLTDEAWARVGVEKDDAAEELRIDLRRLGAEPPGLQTLVLRRLAQSAIGPGALVSRETTAALRALVGGAGSPRRRSLRGRWEAIRERDTLVLRPMAPTHDCAPLSVHVPAPGAPAAHVEFCGRRLTLKSVAGGDHRSPKTSVCLGFSSLPHELLVRHPRTGDRFAPLGLGAETSLARFLREQHMPAARRRRAIVIEAGGAVAWVESTARGLQGRVAESCRVTESTAFTVQLDELPNGAC